MDSRLDPALRELACRFVDTAAHRGLLLRLYGGVAVGLLVERYLVDRHIPAQDIDCICRRDDIIAMSELFRESGYEEDYSVTRAFGEFRRKLRSTTSFPPLDLSIDKLRFSRTLDLRGRLSLRPHTISVADLLLSKLQIRHINEKDLADCVNLLGGYRPGATEDAETFDSTHIALQCARQWGLWRLVTDNLRRLSSYLDELGCQGEVGGMLQHRIQHTLANIRWNRKTMAWRLRSLVGTHARYWDEVSLE